MSEEWSPVAGWEGSYEVSNLGAVRSVDRLVRYSDGRVYGYPGQMLQPSRSPNGYLAVTLKGGGHHRRAEVHRLVAEAFLGQQPEWATLVRHLNGGKWDNRASNLAWGTKSSNGLDSVAHGTHANANKTHCKRGHEYTPENTRVVDRRTTSVRYCRTCDRLAYQKAKCKAIQGEEQG